MHNLSLEMIDEAAAFLENHTLKTPCEYSQELSTLCGVPVYLKLEFLQVTGSFKSRGAFFKLSKLTQEERQRGVVTCSAGNHGKAVAYVAQKMGLTATIFVPKAVDEAKLQGIMALGAKVIHSPFIGYDETEALAKQEAAKSGRPYITPFDDDHIMAANGGTIAKEILQEVPEARTFLLPVGGGGLASGFGFFVKAHHKESRLIGCQHHKSPALQLSLQQKKAVTQLPSLETLAGGIEGGLGANCFHYLQSRIDDVALCTEKELYQAVGWMLDKHQYLIEPSSAPPISALIHRKIKGLKTPCVIVLTGRNVSSSSLYQKILPEAFVNGSFA